MGNLLSGSVRGTQAWMIQREGMSAAQQPTTQEPGPGGTPPPQRSFESPPVMRVCSATFVCEDEPGVTLLLCGKCKVNYYSSAEVQRRHWKEHKPTCREVTETEKALIFRMNLSQTFEAVSNSLRKRGEATTALLVRHLRLCFHETQDEHEDRMSEAGAFQYINSNVEEVKQNFEMHVHTLARGLIFSDSYPFSQLWAAPGMTELLLTGDDLLSPKLRKQKAFFPDGLPSHEFVTDVLTRGTGHSA
mmetsp:Transcript_46755/g.113891  ORF Transcript_46755/g.113891 Transcript_46755/m.113891 type:complete len:246 (+) Transcript_46755:52-789(+)